MHIYIYICIYKFSRNKRQWLLTGKTDDSENIARRRGEILNKKLNESGINEYGQQKVWLKKWQKKMQVHIYVCILLNGLKINNNKKVK